MKCLRCSRFNEEHADRCVCGFPFSLEGEQGLQGWFDEVRHILQSAYIAAPTPWQQSGKGGTFEEWVRLRIPISECITRSGTFLDIGCANGFLLECLLGWTKMKGLDLIPYGLDYAPLLVEMAQQRLSAFKEHIFLGNGWDWQPPRRFTYIRTEGVYVPRNLQAAYLKRLLSEFLEDDGRLLVTHYRSGNEDLTRDWIDEDLRAEGFNVTSTISGFDSAGREKCRVVMLQP